VILVLFLYIRVTSWIWFFSFLLEILRNEAGFCSRKVLAEGLQQDLYDFIIKKAKEFVFDELTDLLAEASWMSV